MEHSRYITTRQWPYGDVLGNDVDARIFEIVSYVILKYSYVNTTIYYGNNLEYIQQVPLTLYKTGRTNANDGGIDFILIPTGRVFQVTETLDLKKYFLDIDKINRYPINFVIKTEKSPEEVYELIEKNAQLIYKNPKVIQKYLDAIESITTIPILKQALEIIIKQGYLEDLVREIILQCKVEFNIPID